MKICEYCRKQYNEKEYSYGEDFCCYVHASSSERVGKLDDERLNNILAMDPVQIYYELTRSIERIENDQIDAIMIQLAKSENAVNKFLQDQDLFDCLFYDEIVRIINILPKKYTVNVLETIEKSSSKYSIYMSIQSHINAIEEKEKRDLIESSIIAFNMGR